LLNRLGPNSCNLPAKKRASQMDYHKKLYNNYNINM